MKKILLALLFIPSLAFATTRTATGLSIALVRDALNGTGSFAGSGALGNGDTLILPAGIGHWDTIAAGDDAVLLLDTKAITLRGAGIRKTIIYDDFRPTSNAQAYVRVSPQPNQHTEISGISFLRGIGHVQGSLDSPTFTFENKTGVSKSVSTVPATRFADNGDIRVHHCEFQHVHGVGGGSPMIRIQSVWGVMDHCLLMSSPTSVGSMIDIYDTNMMPTTGGKGWSSWATPSDYGGFLYNWYFEDCYFVKETSNPNVVVDGREGGRSVWRHCYFDDNFEHVVRKSSISQHGTERAAGGIRHIEIYDTIFANPGTVRPINNRSGTGVMFNCMFVNPDAQAASALRIGWQIDRYSDGTFWGRASGFHPWDDNDLTAGTTGVPQSSPVVGNGTNTDPHAFWIGKIVGLAGACTPLDNLGNPPAGCNNTVIVSAINGTTSPGYNNVGFFLHQWRGYIMTAFDGSDNNATAIDGGTSPGMANAGPSTVGGPIEDSSATPDPPANGQCTLNLMGPSNSPRELAKLSTSGQWVRIYRVRNGIEMNGRAGVNSTSLISGPPNYQLVTGGGAGNHEVCEPWYSWNVQVVSWTPSPAPNGTFAKLAGPVPFSAPWAMHECDGTNATQCHYWQPVDGQNPPTTMLRQPFYAGTTNWSNSADASIGPDSDISGIKGPLTSAVTCSGCVTQHLQTSGVLTVGESYKIVTYVGGDNFVNVGGTNASNVTFTATGAGATAAPTSWSNGSTLQNLSIKHPDWTSVAQVPTRVIANYGDTTVQRSHPLITGGVVQTPQISSAANSGLNTFIAGRTVNCSANPPQNCFHVTTSGFTGTPALSLTSTWSPSTPTPLTFTDNGDGTADIKGTLSGQAVSPPDYVRNIHAVSGAQSDDQSWSLTLSGGNNPPAKPTITIAPTGTSQDVPASWVITAANVSDPDAGDSVQSVSFYHDGLLISTKTSAPWTATFNTSTVQSGIDLTAQSKDTNGGALGAMSDPTTVNATQPAAGPNPPTAIEVSP